jgi:hypothetical protein
MGLLAVIGPSKKEKIGPCSFFFLKRSKAFSFSQNFNISFSSEAKFGFELTGLNTFTLRESINLRKAYKQKTSLKGREVSRGTTFIGKCPLRENALTDNGVTGDAYFRSSGHSSEVIFRYSHSRLAPNPVRFRKEIPYSSSSSLFPFFTQKEQCCQRGVLLKIEENY